MASPRLLLSAALVAAATVAVPASANASVLSSLGSSLSRLTTASDPTCVDGPSSQPFAAWSDDADYVAAPGGSFEPSDGDWSLVGGATVVADNEPWHVSGNDDDASALALRAGASAKSPSFCGGIDHPTLRFFTRATNGNSASALVTVRYTDPGGHLLAALPLGVVTAGKAWAPTSTTLTLSGIKSVTGARLGVIITSLTGTVLVDDVYVDPYRRS